MGGAGFPTYVKLSPPSDKKIDTIIINGAECEPYLTADHKVMVNEAEKNSIWFKGHNEGCRCRQWNNCH